MKDRSTFLFRRLLSRSPSQLNSFLIHVLAEKLLYQPFEDNDPSDNLFLQLCKKGDQEGILFHGSPLVCEGGIEPRSWTAGKRYVYATDNPLSAFLHAMGRAWNKSTEHCRSIEKCSPRVHGGWYRSTARSSDFPGSMFVSLNERLERAIDPN